MFTLCDANKILHLLVPLRRAQPASFSAKAVSSRMGCLVVPVPPTRLMKRLPCCLHRLTCWRPHLDSGSPAEIKISVSQTSCCKVNQGKIEHSVQPWECKFFFFQSQCQGKVGDDMPDCIPNSKTDDTSHFEDVRLEFWGKLNLLHTIIVVIAWLRCLCLLWFSGSFLSHCWEWRLFTVSLHSKQWAVQGNSIVQHPKDLSTFLCFNSPWVSAAAFASLQHTFSLPVVNPKICRVRVHTINTHPSALHK